jgi:hypothetical protein
MSDFQDQIIAQVMSLANTGRPGGVPAIALEPGTAVQLAPGTADVALFPDEEKVEPVGGRNGPLVMRHMALDFQITVAASATQRGSQVAAPIRAWLIAKLGGPNQTLGGLVHGVFEHGTKPQHAQADRPYVVFHHVFIVQYQTLRNNSESAT